jgi:hypothetical protein
LPASHRQRLVAGGAQLGHSSQQAARSLVLVYALELQTFACCSITRNIIPGNKSRDFSHLLWSGTQGGSFMTKTWFAVSALALSLGATSGGLAARAYATPSPSPAQPAYAGQEGRWDEPPSEYRDAQRRGFHDGIEAARRDFQSRRHKDADDHEMYRHPPVERDLRSDYRNAFREGYSRAMNHMRDERHDRDDEPHF